MVCAWCVAHGRLPTCAACAAAARGATRKRPRAAAAEGGSGAAGGGGQREGCGQSRLLPPGNAPVHPQRLQPRRLAEGEGGSINVHWCVHGTCTCTYARCMHMHGVHGICTAHACACASRLSAQHSSSCTRGARAAGGGVSAGSGAAGAAASMAARSTARRQWSTDGSEGQRQLRAEDSRSASTRAEGDGGGAGGARQAARWRAAW